MAVMAAPQVYQLKITLKHVKPPVWRRVVVPDDVTLAQLHGVVQTAMGWSDTHLHEWELDGVRFGDPVDLDDDDLASEEVRLAEIAAEGTRLRYTYDFGDDWEHQVLVEKVRPPLVGEPLPACTGGRRGCPPEDVGGPWGYDDFLEAYGDPGNPEHADLREWAGPFFDPEAFDAAEVTEMLRTGGQVVPIARGARAASTTADVEILWSDEDDEEFLRESDEADREAAAELRERLPGMDSARVPDGELAAAATRLREGIAQGAWPHDWFRKANSWERRSSLPSDDAELWLAAAASVVSPPGEPGWESEMQTFLFTVEQLDWIESITAVVAHGAGAPCSPAALCRHLSGLEPDDEFLVEGSFELVMPLWQALGAVTEDLRLTELGVWGLPLSLVRAWDSPPEGDGQLP